MADYTNQYTNQSDHSQFNDSQRSLNQPKLLDQYHLFAGGWSKLLTQLQAHLESGQTTKFIFTPNPEQIVQAEHNPKFKRDLQQADWLLPDGGGVTTALKLGWGTRQKSNLTRIAGADLAEQLVCFQFDPKKSCRNTLNQKPGSKPGLKSDLKERISENSTLKTKQLKMLVVGGRNYSRSPQVISSSEHPSGALLLKTKDFQVFWTPAYDQASQPTSQEEKELAAIINRLKPDVVFVALGAPLQERWSISHRELLQNSQVKLTMVVGGAFDFILGKVKRAPSWLRKLGLEWLFRLIGQPWRWKRQLRLIEYLWLLARN
ncbi:MAG: WecB/TagA/CpsF family glycosyltransferase [Candidatus Pacebacteria bacterium]|nr:WecB/TagA/CpsF family glycosyltransferase [Candidatus Paceibacterota bacterium]